MTPAFASRTRDVAFAICGWIDSAWRITPENEVGSFAFLDDCAGESCVSSPAGSGQSLCGQFFSSAKEIDEIAKNEIKMRHDLQLSRVNFVNTIFISMILT
jgi:hypothetical protein